MRKLLTVLSFLFVLGIAAAAGIVFDGYRTYTQAGPLAAPALFIIEPGQGVSYIADRLSYAGIISDPLLFRIAARISGVDKALKAGEYRFENGVSMETVLGKLARGAVYERRFTVPEGYTSWQIVQTLNATEGLSGTIEDIPPEGSLLPETYHFTRGDQRSDKIKRMQQAMDELLSALWNNRAEGLPLDTPEEAVILASIVEKETGMTGERDKIAGVFINRLNRGIALQSDPTVIYAMTGGKIENEGQGPIGRKLLKKDLEIDSPYNTYKYPGLPPGPIANPGRAAIRAVLSPEKHDYIYFVADGSGGHAFAKTLEGHNRNVARWRKIRKERESN